MQSDVDTGMGLKVGCGSPRDVGGFRMIALLRTGYRQFGSFCKTKKLAVLHFRSG